MRMIEWLATFFQKRLIAATALPVFVTTSLLLFLPNEFLEKLSIIELVEGNGPYLGFAWLFSLAIILTSIILKIGTVSAPLLKEWWEVRRLKKLLANLTDDEKEFIRPFVIDGKASISAEYADGVANLLIKKNIVARPSNLAVHFSKFAHVLQPWARKELEKRPELLSRN